MQLAGNKELADSLKGKSINPDVTLISFDVSALFTSIPVPVALEVINRKLTAQILQEGLRTSWNILTSSPKINYHTLLELVLNNCVFSFQHKFYKQLQGVAIGSSVSPVIANIYMEYFEKKKLHWDPNAPSPHLSGRGM